jgi:4-amino-4-deoxy-L-arabinose transferase-like glycosyltransferase
MAFGTLIARRRGEDAALATGLLLATMTSIITYSRLCEPDIFLWGIITTAVSLFGLIHVETEARAKTRWKLLFFALLGTSQLAKGLFFGPTLVLGPCGLWLAWHRFEGWKWWLTPRGLAIAVVLGFAWPAAVIASHPEAWALWSLHTFGRLNDATAYNPEPVWYYFTTLPWQAAPALLLALPTLPRAWRTAINVPHSLERFFVAWFVAMFALLTAASAKHHHYIIHALPPVAWWAWCGLPWWAARVKWLWSQAWYRWTSPVVFAGAIAFAAMKVQAGGFIAAWEVALVGGAILLGLTASAECLRRGRERAAAIAFFVTLVTITTAVNLAWLGRNDIYADDVAIAQRLTIATAPEDVLLVYKIDPARLLIDLPRSVRVIEVDDDLPRLLTPGRSQWIVTVMLFEEELKSKLKIVEADRAPKPKWPGRPISQTVVYRTVP